MAQAVQITGALLILLAYLLAHAGLWSPASYRYLVPNLVGSSMLAVNAFQGEQWGFVLLEGVWAIVTGWSLVEKLRGQQPEAAH